MNSYIYILIGITGILSTLTDIFERKIKNIHLLIISSITIILYCIFFILGKLNVAFPFIVNPFVALAMGLILYIVNLWKAGDAKLFFTYSLLLPVNQYSSILPFSCLVLLVNTFLIGFLFVLPLFFKNIISDRDTIIKEIFSKKSLIYFGKIFIITFGISWIIKPILSFFPLKDNIFLNFVLLYTSYLLVYKFINKIKNKSIVISIFITGLLLRYTFMPESFSSTSIIRYLKYILGYSTIFYVLRIIIDLGKKNQQRIPFAPFMFLGTLLSNTNFLWWVIKTLTYLRR